ALPNRIAVIKRPLIFICSPPCARFARALGAPRTAHFATPPLGAGALVIALELQTQTCSYSPLMTSASTSLCRRSQISSETAGYIAFAAAAVQVFAALRLTSQTKPQFASPLTAFVATGWQIYKSR